MDDIVLYDMKSPKIPKDWDYKKSVTKMKKLVVNWKNISVEILQELHVAKTKLLSQGVRNDLDPNGVKLGWENYLRDTGLSKETVRRWLSRYNPETKIILPKESEGNGKLITGTPGYKVLNFYGGIDHKNFGLNMYLNNIFNADYRTHGSGINGIGRSISLMLSLKLNSR